MARPPAAGRLDLRDLLPARYRWAAPAMASGTAVRLQRALSPTRSRRHGDQPHAPARPDHRYRTLADRCRPRRAAGLAVDATYRLDLGTKHEVRRRTGPDR